MADNFPNGVGIAAIRDWVKAKFTNAIETVKVNGTPLVPDAQKAVDVEAAQLSPSRNNGELQGMYVVQGDNELRVFKSGRVVMMDDTETIGVDLATVEYVDESGGKIDRVLLNGTEVPIISKGAYISAAEMAVSGDYDTEGANVRFQCEGDGSAYGTFGVTKTANGLRLSADHDAGVAKGFNVEVPSKTYADTTFRTEQQVQAAIDASLADVTGIDFQVVSTLPASGVKGTIYLVGDSTPYDEYIWVIPEGGTAHWEQIGSTDVDLSNYWTSEEGKPNSLVAYTYNEVMAILEA